jgi:hypothetical protein
MDWFNVINWLINWVCALVDVSRRTSWRMLTYTQVCWRMLALKAVWWEEQVWLKSQRKQGRLSRLSDAWRCNASSCSASFLPAPTPHCPHLHFNKLLIMSDKGPIDVRVCVCERECVYTQPTEGLLIERRFTPRWWEREFLYRQVKRFNSFRLKLLQFF